MSPSEDLGVDYYSAFQIRHYFIIVFTELGLNAISSRGFLLLGAFNRLNKSSGSKESSP